MKFNAPRGTEDILPADSWRWQVVERIARDLATLYHFAEIRTPTYENTEVFHRGVGEASDIVRKETFTFETRGGDSITLRARRNRRRRPGRHRNRADEPGGLAPQGLLHRPEFSPRAAPKRPAARQHHQFGVEAFGIADSAARCRMHPPADGVLPQLRRVAICRCTINSMGDRESKGDYRARLVKFLNPKPAGNLSEDSRSAGCKIRCGFSTVRTRATSGGLQKRPSAVRFPIRPEPRPISPAFKHC